ncbi:MAG: AAA family ATPase, partial [Clostridia bacterium]
MYISELEIYNFRNYALQKVEFIDGLNIVCGKNAQGKTNLVEAIYLLSTGSSPRAVSDKEMINLNADRARVSAKVVWDTGVRDVEMVLSRREKKRASVNDLNIAKIGELLGNINTVYFSPDEMSLIKDSPEYRRRFMDIDLCQLSRAYFYVLNKY